MSISAKDIIPGDVLLFATDDSNIDKLICWLTNSNVAHAALCYQAGVLVDAGLAGVGAHTFKDQPGGRVIYVRRPNYSLPMAPVTTAAYKYVEEVDPYDKPGLFLLACLLLVKKFTPSTWTQKLYIAVLKKLVAILDKLIDEKRYPGKHPMVCSQYVFQSFQDAGRQYELKIKGGVLLRSGANEDGKTLLEQLMDMTQSRALTTVIDGLPNQPEDNADIESLVGQLHESLMDDLAGSKSNPLEAELVASVHALGGRLQTISAAGEPILEANGLKFLSGLVHQNALFVAPADLMSHCEDLHDIGNLPLDRSSENWKP